MNSEEASVFVPLPIKDPRPRTLWLALGSLLFIIMLAVVGAVAALTGAQIPFLPSSTDSADGQSARQFLNAPPLPKIAPVEYLKVAPETAKQINDAVPFTKDPVPAASPLFLKFTTPADQQRAVDCLAAAVWYEAGNDPTGQSAVAQVVINRMRHGAFPNSVCGVVFQGSERKTGCQFTFTCDGSIIRRRPAPAMWSIAQGIALTALRGMVFSRVGWATHYHTDWVVPNWSSSVDKVAAIDTHLFFRWRGANGKPRAFHNRHTGVEPRIQGMTGLSLAHGETADGPAIAEANGAAELASLSLPVDHPPAVPEVNLRGTALARASTSENLYVIKLDSGQLTGSTALIGVELCSSARAACTVAGFVGTPGRAVARTMGKVEFPDRLPDFYYFVDRSRGRERILWNCNIASRPNQSQCMPHDFRADG